MPSDTPADTQSVSSDQWTDAELEMLGIKPASEGGVLFCGVELQEYAISGVTYQWPRGSHLLWRLDFSRLGPLSDMDVADAWTECLKEYAGCCDLTFGKASASQVPNLLITTRRLDGASGVLADCEIPVGNVNPGTTLKMRIDDSENWGIVQNPPRGIIDLYRVLLHEGLHGLGLGHKPANVNEKAVIAPIYDVTLRSLQPADKGELVRRYGQPKQVPGGGGTQPGAPMSVPVRVEIDAHGFTYRATGVAKR
jgi:hypothetical protein